MYFLVAMTSLFDLTPELVHCSIENQKDKKQTIKEKD